MLVRISQTPAILEKLTGARPHRLTVNRWVSKGVRGIKLQSTMVGGLRFTTREWIKTFVDEINNQDRFQDHSPGLAQAEKALERAGI